MCSDTTRPREPIGDQLTTDQSSDVEERLYRRLHDAVSRNDASKWWHEKVLRHFVYRTEGTGEGWRCACGKEWVMPSAGMTPPTNGSRSTGRSTTRTRRRARSGSVMNEERLYRRLRDAVSRNGASKWWHETVLRHFVYRTEGTFRGFVVVTGRGWRCSCGKEWWPRR